MRIALTLVVFSALQLSGCATRIESWTHDKYTDPRERYTRSIEDKQLCYQVASNSTPIENVEKMRLTPPQTGYNISGTATTTNYGAGVYGTQATATATPQQSFSSGFAQGWNNGLAIGEAVEKGKRIKRFNECMMKLGWKPSE